jgi:hypothetical protein
MWNDRAVLKAPRMKPRRKQVRGKEKMQWRERRARVRAWSLPTEERIRNLEALKLGMRQRRRRRKKGRNVLVQSEYRKRTLRPKDQDRTTGISGKRWRFGMNGSDLFLTLLILCGRSLLFCIRFAVGRYFNIYSIMDIFVQMTSLSMMLYVCCSWC